jgi:hypothetical protein
MIDVVTPVVEITVVVALLAAVIYQAFASVRKVFRFRW